MRRLLSVLICMTLLGCGKSLPEFKNLNLTEWKADKNGCGAYRSNHIEEIKTQKNNLLALDQSQIIELLGRPDRNELYTRNQKFFKYYLEADSACSHSSANASLVIRFNALGLAKEVAIE